MNQESRLQTVQLKYFLNQNKKYRKKTSKIIRWRINKSWGGLCNQGGGIWLLNIRFTNVQHCLDRLKSVMLTASITLSKIWSTDFKNAISHKTIGLLNENILTLFLKAYIKREMTRLENKPTLFYNSITESKISFNTTWSCYKSNLAS